MLRNLNQFLRIFTRKSRNFSQQAPKNDSKTPTNNPTSEEKIILPRVTPTQTQFTGERLNQKLGDKFLNPNGFLNENGKFKKNEFG